MNLQTEPILIQTTLHQVARRVAPLWDLENYVAVNPFVGFIESPIGPTDEIIHHALDSQILPSVSYFRQRWAMSEFEETDLQDACGELGIDFQELKAILEGTQEVSMRCTSKSLSYAETLDQQQGTHWATHITNSICDWLASTMLENGYPPEDLYKRWIASCQLDLELPALGLKSWSHSVRQSAKDPYQATSNGLQILQIPDEKVESYLLRLLGHCWGWASYLRRFDWSVGNAETKYVEQLLAILVVAESSLLLSQNQAANLPWPASAKCVDQKLEDPMYRQALQVAAENGYVRNLAERVSTPSDLGDPIETQILFCIDVRSEPLRRHIESLSSKIQTKGFAGFFGVAISLEAADEPSARCPVLLKPSLAIQGHPFEAKTSRGKLVDGLLASPINFSSVETFGLKYGTSMLRKLLRTPSQSSPTPRLELPKLDLPDRIRIAESILKFTGLRTGCAKTVILCGHRSKSENNAHSAGLECGACGGHEGGTNARVACMILNDPEVREALAQNPQMMLPRETVFYPAVHNTTTDDVEFLEAKPDAATQAVMAKAGRLTRLERSAHLLSGTSPALVDDRFSQKANDWSDARPEWGLARNAAFIVAPRSRTRGIDLAGRTFLHCYDEEDDSDGSILGLILSAPMVVASWINLQYFASTVDNDRFGAGPKALQNRVGDIGVILGNRGDLCTGLAKESVHLSDGRWYHEPLRLQVVVQASPEKIEQQIRANPVVFNLVRNGWIRIYSLSKTDNQLLRRPLGDEGQFVAWPQATSPFERVTS